MLSATLGPVPLETSGLEIAARVHNVPRVPEAGMFALMHGGYHNPSAMLSGLGDGPGMWSHTAGVSPLISKPTQHTSQYQNLSSPVSPLTASASTTVYVVVVTSGPMVIDYYKYLPATLHQSAIHMSPPPMSSALQLPKPTTGGTAFEPPSGSSISAIYSLPLSAALSGIPSAARIVERDFDSAALVPQRAFDVAFQSYSSQLLLVAAGASSEREIIGELDDQSASMDRSFDDFIHLESFSIVGDELSPGDAVGASGLRWMRCCAD